MHVSPLALGFHGCEKSVGERVLRGETDLQRDDQEYHWLGFGVYFWENSLDRAIEWAWYVKEHPKYFKTRILTPFVIGAIINLGNCLDLTEAENLRFVKAAHDDLRDTFAKAGKPFPENEPGFRNDRDLVKRGRDCAVINHAHFLRNQNRHLPRFDTVRSPFFEGRKLYEGGGIRAKTHVQICVRNPATAIVGYFRPRRAQTFSLHFS